MQDGTSRWSPTRHLRRLTWSTSGAADTGAGGRTARTWPTPQARAPLSAGSALPRKPRWPEPTTRRPVRRAGDPTPPCGHHGSSEAGRSRAAHRVIASSDIFATALDFCPVRQGQAGPSKRPAPASRAVVRRERPHPAGWGRSFHAPGAGETAHRWGLPSRFGACSLVNRPTVWRFSSRRPGGKPPAAPPRNPTQRPVRPGPGCCIAAGCCANELPAVDCHLASRRRASRPPPATARRTRHQDGRLDETPRICWRDRRPVVTRRSLPRSVPTHCLVRAVNVGGSRTRRRGPPQAATTDPGQGRRPACLCLRGPGRPPCPDRRGTPVAPGGAATPGGRGRGPSRTALRVGARRSAGGDLGPPQVIPGVHRTQNTRVYISANAFRNRPGDPAVARRPPDPSPASTLRGGATLQ
jgi:hypothetical protein